ncbi:MAG: hypothetical protein R3C10_11215 [Pirellulales bacterium]|nr:hypothetical protein [Planctomycetales bacterium]
MYSASELDEYLVEMREQVCSNCIERPAGGPPCAPLGKRCGIELHLSKIVDFVHAGHSTLIGPYADRLHNDVCAHCPNSTTRQCPCPLDYLLVLAVQAVESVDERHKATAAEV